MTSERELERTLERWLVDGVDEMPDRVYLTILDRVERQSQRPAWRLHPWRFPTMSTPMKLVAIGAALLAVLLGGAVFLGGGAGPAPTPLPTPTPTPTAAPSPTPSPTAVPTATPMPRGELDPGTYVTHPIAGDALTWQVTVPLGWTNVGEWYLYPTALGGPGGKDESGTYVGATVAFVNRPQIFADSCDFGTMTGTSTVAELVAAIQAKVNWVVSTPVDVTISGFAGQRVDVALPADMSVCGVDNNPLLIGSTGTENGFFQQGPSQQVRLFILDAGDRIVLLAHESFPATPVDKAAEVQAVIESSVITP